MAITNIGELASSARLTARLRTTYSYWPPSNDKWSKSHLAVVGTLQGAALLANKKEPVF